VQGARVALADESGEDAPVELPVLLARIGEGSPMPPASAISFAMRRSARPEPYCSMQPCAPQPQGRPSGTTRRWPSSPAVPNPPRRRRSPVTIAPPTPVPIVSIVMSRTSRAAPKRNSAQPAAFASLSIVTSIPSLSRSRSRKGSLRQLMLGA